MRVESFTLDNGLTVGLAEDRAQPAVSVLVRYAVGTREDPRDAPGLAHLFEHLMFEGTEALGARLAEKRFEDAGLSIRNATTGLDYTDYYEQISPRALAFALWSEADRMATLDRSLDEEKLERVRAIVVRERLQRIETAGAGNAYVEIMRALYPASHPYHHRFDADAEGLSAIELDDAREFFRTHYTPDVATLVVAGNFDSGEAKTWIAQDFGPIARGRAIATSPARAAPPPMKHDRRIVLEADLRLPETWLAWVTPPVGAPGDDELDALVAFTDLLEAELHETNLASHVEIDHPSRDLGGELTIRIVSPPATSSVLVERAVRAALAHLDRPDHELALQRWMRSTARSRLEASETPLGRAALVAYGLTIEGDPYGFSAICERRRALTLERVRSAVQRHLLDQKHVTLSIVPNTKASRAGDVVSREDR